MARVGVFSIAFKKEGQLLRYRTKAIILAYIAVFLISILFIPGQSFKAEEIQGSTGNHFTGSWVNPYYVDIQLQSQPVGTMQPMAEATTYTAANETELRSVIYQAFTNREIYPQITYTGDVSSLGDVNEFGSLINVDGLTSIIQTTINTDDYLKYNLASYPYSVLQGATSSTISFIDDNDPANPTYITYLTTLAQENDVDAAVTTILSAIIEPVMNDHQKVKAIHDYIVANVAYDTTYVEHSAYAALFGAKQTVCQGYALLAYKMLTEAGFEARIIGGMAGTTSPEAHAWNRVLLDSKWYNLDCTWDDPTPDETGRVLYPYYNMSDVEFIADHTADSEYTGLPAAAESYTTTLENLIAANPANEIYPRLQQQLGFTYLLATNTAADATALEAKWLVAAQNEISNYKVRYNNSSDDLNSKFNDIFQSIASKTTLIGCDPAVSYFNRGAGTGYVLLELALTYSTTNQHPTASAVSINGYANVGQTLTGSYVYADADIPGDAEGLSQYQWYRGVNSDGTDKIAIPGAIGSRYTVNSRDAGKYLFFEVLPIASTGTLQGTSVLSATSAAVGPVLEKAAQPTSNVAVGAVTSGTTVTLSTTTTGASIYYTIDGTTPTKESGTLYDGTPITIDVAKTIKAITVKDGMLPSDVAEFVYTIAVADNCFIATAAFGSKFDWPVALLRAFRDQYLLTNPAGRAFVDFYYHNSPPIAAFIAGSEPLKALVRVLLAPVIAIVYMIYHPALLLIFLIFAALRRTRLA